jgi:hypothetical protein
MRRLIRSAPCCLRALPGLTLAQSVDLLEEGNRPEFVTAARLLIVLQRELAGLMIKLELRDRGIERLLLAQQVLQLGMSRLRWRVLPRPQERCNHRRQGEKDQEGSDQVFHALTAPTP